MKTHIEAVLTIQKKRWDIIYNDDITDKMLIIYLEEIIKDLDKRKKVK